MSADGKDLAIARYLRDLGLASSSQIDAAIREQARLAAGGESISLAESLVRMGVLTAAQRETVEQKASAREGVQQLGPYKLLKKLGEGGMGAVYLSEEADGRRVALKILPKRHNSNVEFLKRFKREAEAAIALRHPNIVAAYSVGEELGFHFYVMEYAEGEPLDRLLRREGMLPVPQAINIVLQAARALAHAHARGIIHRDIKPANLILTKSGAVKLLDLGLSKNIEEAERSFKTLSGAVLGTPHYIAPEQAKGEKNVDGRADLYSLGATLYHLLAGRPPFDGESILSILNQHVTAQLPDPRDERDDIPDGVVHVLRRLMAKEPKDRYEDADALLQDLDEITAGRAPKSDVIDPGRTTIAVLRRRTSKSKPGTVRRVSVSLRRRAGPSPLLWVAGGAALFLVVAVAVAFSGRKAPPPAKAVEARAPEAAPEKPPSPPEKPAAPAETPAFVKADPWEKAVDLLSPVDPARTTLRGTWTREGSGLRSGDRELQQLELPYRPPEEYDLRVEFTPRGPVPDVNVIVTRRGRPFQWVLGGWGNRAIGFSEPGSSPTTGDGLLLRSPCLEPGRRVSTVVRVRRHGVTGFLDERELVRREDRLDALGLVHSVRVRDGSLLGLLSFGCATEFHAVKLLPILGEGRAVEPPPAPVGEQAEFLAATRVLPPDEQLRRVVDRLRELNRGYDGRHTPRVEGGQVTEFTVTSGGLAVAWPLRAFDQLRLLDLREARDFSRLADLAGLAPAALLLSRTKVAELDVLRSMPVERLLLNETPVADLSPLRGGRIRALHLAQTAVRDLEPLAGLPLEELSIGGSQVRDLAPLRGLPLRALRAGGGPFNDLGPLATLRHLEELDIADALLAPEATKRLLRSLPALRLVNGKPAEEVLGKPPEAPAAERPDVPARWAAALDLLALVDPAKDAVAGAWSRTPEGLGCGREGYARIRIPFRPPEEYDVRMEFTRRETRCGATIIVPRGERAFTWEMGPDSNQNYGIGSIDGRPPGNNATTVPARQALRDGVRHVTILQVRRDRVSAWLDGRRLVDYPTDYANLTLNPDWRVPGSFGVGSCDTPAVFHRIDLLEVSGRGTPLDHAARRLLLNGRDLEGWKVSGKAEVREGAAWLSAKAQMARDVAADLSLSGEILFEKSAQIRLHGTTTLALGAEGVVQFSDRLKKAKSAPGALPAGAWQGFRLRLAGEAVELLVGGKSVLSAKRGAAKPGPLVFAAESGALALRSLRLDEADDGRPWRAIMSGGGLEWLVDEGQGYWALRSGALERVPTARISAAQTTEKFGDGELRIRFEGRDLEYLFFSLRQSEAGLHELVADRRTLLALGDGVHEVIVRMAGPKVEAEIDGKKAALRVKGRPEPTGHLQFNAVGGVFRVLSIEHRP